MHNFGGTTKSIMLFLEKAYIITLNGPSNDPRNLITKVWWRVSPAQFFNKKLKKEL